VTVAGVLGGSGSGGSGFILITYLPSAVAPANGNFFFLMNAV
jgi:hypothetical protein